MKDEKQRKIQSQYSDAVGTIKVPKHKNINIFFLSQGDKNIFIVIYSMIITYKHEITESINQKDDCY